MSDQAKQSDRDVELRYLLLVCDQGPVFVSDNVEEGSLTIVLFFQTLKSIPWTADYTPPAPPDESTVTQKTPEEIEREIKVRTVIFVIISCFVKRNELGFWAENAENWFFRKTKLAIWVIQNKELGFSILHEKKPCYGKTIS